MFYPELLTTPVQQAPVAVLNGTLKDALGLEQKH